MEILQNSFLEAPFKKLTDIYANEIVPKLTKKNKLIGISAAILMIVAYQINSIIRPPRNLRHIPRQGYFNFLSSLLGNEPILKRAQRYALPLVNSNKNNGLYLVTN
jgi:hypothetical protein